ncbi:unnamed protein product [Sphenostylis stenocarpa]|uniref:TH1 domain-containing protein n=1 Tax=Sphenostylis stenocarpa TaxID=92480 RepID=A0AA86RVZ4_9FABA|nr:unnamed protein product [Sphenostylis stenocarpa]
MWLAHWYLNCYLEATTLAAIEKICVSELSDNFLVVMIPTEYDLLIASARKNEIITAFVEAYGPEVVSSNSKSFTFHVT